MRAAPTGQGMNANGSRFHLLVGDDWKTATSGGVPLGQLWQRPDQPDWPVQSRHSALTLPPRDPYWVDVATPAPPESARRGAAADRHGNLYVVDQTCTGITVVSSGTGTASRFWPAPDDRPPSPGPFAPAVATPPPPGRLGPLMVTTEHHLLAVLRDDTQGDSFLRFDLLAGGGPTWHRPAAHLAIRAMTAAPDGGLWLVDGLTGAVLALDRALGIRGQAERPPLSDLFQPEGGQERTFRPPAPPVGLATGAADPVALALLPDGSVLLLDAGPPARLIRVAADGAAELLALDPAHRHMAARPVEVGERDGAPVVVVEVTLAGAVGQTADRFHLVPDPGQGARFRVERIPGAHPLRRFGGRGLVLSKDHVLYDSGTEAWAFVPVLALRGAAFSRKATLETPLLDSGIPGCRWDRLRLDMCVPPGASIHIAAVAGDSPEAPGIAGPWHELPAPCTNGDGGDRPAHHGASGRGEKAKGWAVHDLLLHGVEGRFARFRITLEGDGRVSPSLQALRAWFPRFSWGERFLPAVFRSTPEDADFLDRFLANFEGVATGIEDRIVAAHQLLDPRTTPADALTWLARWFDLAFDPLLDLPRRRLFLANAMNAFAWRGTVPGIRAALRLAFDEAPDSGIFTMTAPQPPGGIRIIEAFRTRGRPPSLAAANDQSEWTPASPFLAVAGGPELPQWTVADGSPGLVLRLARGQGRDPTDADFARPLRLDGDGWGEAFAPVIRAAIGFLPRLGPQEAERWAAFQQCQAPYAEPAALPQGAIPETLQGAWSAYCSEAWGPRAAWVRFLTRRYGSAGRLNAAWGTGFGDLGEVPLPAVFPANATRSADWLLFEGRVAPLEAAAHRFTVLLPRNRLDPSPEAEARALALARRIVEVEKPAHTVFDVRFFWAMNRVGEAVLGDGIPIGPGARAPELNPPAVLGRAQVGASFAGAGRATLIRSQPFSSPGAPVQESNP